MNIPNHVAIIMDGNGRWAKARGLDRSQGHKKGCETLEELCEHVFDRGVNYLSIYAFSTDNFKRPEKEVTFLMNLFVKMFTKKMKRILEKGIKIVFSGRREGLREDVLKSMDNITNISKDNQNGTLNICINYGSQEEIIDAFKKLYKEIEEGKVLIDSLERDSLYKYMYQDLPPIDFLIRTSGEERLSNFMLYQLTYSEFYFPDTYFPDFDSKEFDRALEVYNSRDRRFGKVPKNK